jgi:predicted GIY-YIG superfamily endonuclease
MKPFFVYMLRCKDGSYYVGHTDDLEQRMAQHEDGTFGGYTCKRRPVELVWVTELETRDEALQREMQVKPWSGAKKEALIRSEWDELKRLARGRDRSRPSTSPGPSTGSGPGYARDERNVGPYADGDGRDERIQDA